MNKLDIETAVIEMGDVGTVIEMVERFLLDGNTGEAERAVSVLREIYENRYTKLQNSIHT